MNQLQKLLDIYSAYPCRTLPNAFWKTAKRIEDSRLLISKGGDDQLASLAIWDGERMMAFWCADPSVHPLDQVEIAKVPFALVHNRALPVFEQRDFALRQPYFRLVKEGRTEAGRCPQGFGFTPFRPETDINAVVSLIRASYENIRVNPSIVKAWMRHPVYDPDLWLWVIDLESHEKVGLGIAERDPRVPEASLEWIQVLPAYQGRGLGTAIVTELLGRVSRTVKFTTVAGDLKNVHQPEQLYRRCGFTGEDVWWLLSDVN